MKIDLKFTWVVFRDTFKKFFDENPFRHSAAIAYYTIFSLPGIAIISVMIAGSFYEDETVRNELIKQVSLLMGDSSAQQVELIMSRAFQSSDSLVMEIVGAITLLISATTVFVSLQDSLNTIWNIKPKPKKEIVKFFINRLWSLAMIASIGFLILVSLTVDTLLAIVKQAMSGHLEGTSYVLVLIVNVVLSLVIITFVFALIYKVLPDAQIKWNDVWKGAMVTTGLFVVGKYLIGYYLGTSNLGDAYGAAGSLVAMLAWIYYSVLILIFGAQFTFVYNKHKGRVIRPDKGAVAVVIEEVERGHESVTDIK